ncbi:MAG TPA: sulfotransferase domain-containing protein [Gaiellaceae bacterium]
MPDSLRTRIERQAQSELLRARKRGYRLIHPFPRTGRKAIVLIVGCQRSGTTMILQLFTDDRRSVTFQEKSSLSSPAEEHLRLKPLPDVKRSLERIRSPLLVLKPLVESQNTPALLDGLDNSFAIWMYRRAESVAASDLAYFGAESGERNLRLLLSDDPPNWRGEFVPETTRAVISEHYRPGMSPNDAAALFWWARTSLFFDLRLDARPDVRLCSYERLVADPEPTMRSLYEFVGVAYPDRRITGRVHRESARRGEHVVLSPEVQQLCDELLERLDSVPTGAREGVPDPSEQPT